MKRRRKEVKAPAPVIDANGPVPGRPWYGLYVGQGTDPDPQAAMVYAGCESSVLVIGPPRCGKTSSVVVPGVLDAPAAVVSTSTKPDVLAATIFRRHALGNCYVFDPTGSTPIPPGAYPLRWSPVTGCRHWEQAVATAHSLAGAARPQASLSEGAHWVERAEALLAPLLFAADSAGPDMATVVRWVLEREVRRPLTILENCGHQMALATLRGVAATEDRERSGIFSTAAGLLSAYRSDAALAGTTRVNFDPERFVTSTDTLYICAPAAAQDQLAPIVVALLDRIRTACYARPIGAAPVVFALDEVANIAPLPSLPALAAEGGGQGLITMACLQDLSQARTRWGDAAEGFFSIFTDKLVFPGIGDHRTLHLLGALAGEKPVQMRSVTVARNVWPPVQQRAITASVTWRPRLSLDEAFAGRPGHALCIRPQGMGYVVTPPWWEHPIWARVARARGPLFSEQVRPAGHHTLAEATEPAS